MYLEWTKIKMMFNHLSVNEIMNEMRNYDRYKIVKYYMNMKVGPNA